MKSLFIITLFFLTFSFSTLADSSHFIDIKKILNTSKAGAEAQKKLKQRLKTQTEKFKKLEDGVRKEEAEIISQKKVISAEEYKKKVEALRKKVAVLQKDKQKSFNNLAKTRSDARVTLLKSLNPIVKKYMQEKKIRLIIDKKSVILGDTSLEITEQIITILNKELPSIKVN